MCEPSREVLAAATAPTKTRRHRLKLWEIDPRLHCSVIGTCLRLPDMRQLCTRAGISIERAMSDYELHHAFVQAAASPAPLARQVQKLLDRRFRSVLARFAGTRDRDVLRRLWNESLEAGEVAGAYWAILTHPAVETALVDQVAGEVHMLSHIAGAGRHADRRRLDSLERDNARLGALVGQLRQTLHRRSERKNRELVALREALARTRRQLGEVEAERQRLSAIEDGRTLRELRRERDRLAAALARAEQKLAHERAASARLQPAPGNSGHSIVPRPDRPDAPRPCPHEPVACTAEDCPGIDLCGQCILYVGGRAALNHHLAALVGRCNGRWLEHDGGREDTPTRLQQLLPRADAVICPVDCVSHDAVRRVKRFCKQHTKRLILLKSASLSSLARGLEALAPDREAQPRDRKSVV